MFFFGIFVANFGKVVLPTVRSILRELVSSHSANPAKPVVWTFDKTFITGPSFCLASVFMQHGKKSQEMYFPCHMWRNITKYIISPILIIRATCEEILQSLILCWPVFAAQVQLSMLQFTNIEFPNCYNLPWASMLKFQRQIPVVQ